MIGSTNSVIQIGTIERPIEISNGYPIEISDPAELDTVATVGNIGKIYKYTGTTTDKYVQNELDIIVNDEEFY